jgi:hypothetical protein
MMICDGWEAGCGVDSSETPMPSDDDVQSEIGAFLLWSIVSFVSKSKYNMKDWAQ